MSACNRSLCCDVLRMNQAEPAGMARVLSMTHDDGGCVGLGLGRNPEPGTTTTYLGTRLTDGQMQQSPAKYDRCNMRAMGKKIQGNAPVFLGVTQLTTPLTGHGWGDELVRRGEAGA